MINGCCMTSITDLWHALYHSWNEENGIKITTKPPFFRKNCYSLKSILRFFWVHSLRRCLSRDSEWNFFQGVLAYSILLYSSTHYHNSTLPSWKIHNTVHATTISAAKILYACRQWLNWYIDVHLWKTVMYRSRCRCIIVCVVMYDPPGLGSYVERRTSKSLRLGDLFLHWNVYLCATISAEWGFSCSFAIPLAIL